MTPHDEERTGAKTHTYSALDRLHVVAMWPGGTVTRELPPGGRLVVGRSKRCDLAIDHPSVSREHAVFHGGPPLTLEDLGSTNGTTLNGARLTSSARVGLEGGQVVTIGAAVLVVCGDTPAPAASRRDPKPRGERGRVVLEDGAMKELHRIVELVANGDLPIVLLGETGAGKDVLAEAVHRRSPRASGPFVRVNCAAQPATLLESELFGYERGAFTGALQAKPGLVETAEGGTLFLDEIGELPLAMQAKLLAMLESREVTRVGGLRARTIDVRFVAATNRDIARLVTSGAFREDLYFRLNGISLTVPPLRARPDEVLPLAREFVAAGCRERGRGPLEISPAAAGWLGDHEWPGNVRELRNVMQRAVALCGGDVIEICDLVPETTLGPAPPSDRRHKAASTRAARSTEKQRIADVMARCGGNQTRAAKMLGISRRTLVSRLTEHGFARPLKGRPDGE